jgi:pyruvate formate lyase activating enzyme
VAELAEALQERGIPVILDTAGCVAWGRFETVLPYVDTVFFDWKTSDPTFMSERIRGSLRLVKDNLTRLLKTGKDIHVRIPLIPAINTTEEALAAIAADLREVGAKTVALLPFHRLAVGKYEAMGIPYPYRDTPPLSAETLRRAAEILSKDFTVYTEK